MIKKLFSNPEYLVLLAAVCLYGPFLGEPVLRTTGDEKVYIAQAFEMQARGSWFVQTLADVPNYYKGPLHYILIQWGYLLFGTQSLWSALWMNLVCLAGSAFVLTRCLRSYWQDSDAALWVGLGLIFAPGVFAHAFASQMELELTALYAMVLSCLLVYERRPSRSLWMGLWLLVGLAAWLKSPLHSALLGIGIVLYGLRQGPKLWSFWTPPLKILGVLPGVIFACSAYLTPWLLDPEAFYRTYILRETVGKGPNGVQVWESILPNISYHMWPLAPQLLLGGLVLAAYALFGKSCALGRCRKGIGLALLLALPTLVFFAWHPYRSEIYSLPVIPALLVVAIGIAPAIAGLHPKLWSRTQLFALSWSVVPTCLVIAIDLRFAASNAWWPSWLLPTACLAFGLQLLGILVLVRNSSPSLPAHSLFLWAPALIVMALFMKVLGLEDLRGLRQISQQFPTHQIYGFYNAERFVWSEWGLLNLSSGLKVKGLHDLESVRSWILAGKPIIVSNQSERSKVESLVPEVQFRQLDWVRWASHGTHSTQKNPKLAWQKRDLTLLRQSAYVMVREW